MSFKARNRTNPVASLGSPIDADTQRRLAQVADAAERGLAGQGSELKPPPANQPSASQTIAALQFSGDTGALVVSNIYHLPLRILRENQYNSRRVFSAADHDEMCKSLEVDGQLEDCIGHVEEGTVVLQSGHRRFRAAKQIGLKTLRVRIEAAPGDGLAAYLQSNKYNIGHKPQSDLDKALSYHLLVANKQVKDQKALAAVLAEDEGSVSRLMSIAKLPEQIITLVSDAPSMLTASVLYEIHLLNQAVGLQKTLIAIADCRASPLSQRELQRIRKQLTEAPKTKPRSIRQEIAFGTGKGESKVFEEEGRFEMHLTGLSKQDMKEVVKFAQQFAKPASQASDQ